MSEEAETVDVTEAPADSAPPANDVDVLTALHSEVERLELDRGPMSPVERRLANAILVMLNVMINERSQPASVPAPQQAA